MKTKAILISVIILFSIVGMGCKDVSSDLYTGKIITLNNHAAFTDIIEIQQSVAGGLAIGKTISVGTQLTDKGYKLNDIVYFKVTYYQKWIGPETADHLWPSYTGVIELASFK